MKRWEWVTVAAVVLAWGANLPAGIADPIGRFEGRYWPVTERMAITEDVEIGDNWTTISGTMTKLRDCEFVEMRWFYGTPDARSSVQYRIEEGAKVRKKGAFNFGPWSVQLSIEDLKSYQTADGYRSASYAEVYHDCPLFRFAGVTLHKPWTTITQMWPGTGTVFIPLEAAP